MSSRFLLCPSRALRSRMTPPCLGPIRLRTFTSALARRAPSEPEGPKPPPPPPPGPERKKREAMRLSSIGFVATAGVLGAVLVFGVGTDALHADAPQEAKRSSDSLASLARTYLVYSICSVPALVDRAPGVLEALMRVPVVSALTEKVVRATFFAQFVGADTAEECLPLLRSLRAANTGCLFAYSVEVDEAAASGARVGALAAAHEQPPHKKAVAEMIHCIDVAADFEDGLAGTAHGRRTWVALKLTALVPDAQALTRFSAHLVRTRPASPEWDVAFPGFPHGADLDVLSGARTDLTPDDFVALSELRDDLFRICVRARERGVKIIVDAEYSWYQPAVDAYALALMRHFNRLPDAPARQRFWSAAPRVVEAGVQPLVYQTYQAYLRRTPEYLRQSLADARAYNYALGVKLVRGAYHTHELAAHPSTSTSSLLPSISPDAHPPVWQSKPETDACYEACRALLIDQVAQDIRESTATTRSKGVARVGVLFGTHNVASARGVLDAIVEHGLGTRGADGVVTLGAEVTERINMGQLYGMSDELTDEIVARTRSSAPFVLKYVPYGALQDVMPYLGRRAIENKSVLFDGAAARERQRALREIRRRIFG